MDSAPLEEVLGRRLEDRIQTIATAESCSGGLIAHLLTNVPGSSHYFAGGIVAYSNDAKVRLLGVDAQAIQREGAVSETVARQLAEGARARFGADWGIGVTGIAGPSGGSAEKPVGLVFVAVASSTETVVVRNQFSGIRPEIKRQTAEKALSMALEQLG